MDLRVRAFHLLILLSGLCLLQGGSSNSVLFLDGSENKYIRSHTETADEANLMSLSEVAATISVLLGVAPPVSLPAESSLKLDKILTPNPFSRPRAVVMLEVQGIGDLSSALHSILQGDSPLSGKIIGSGNAHIELFGDDEVSQISIDEPRECGDREFSNLARWLGGSYVGSMESQDGELEFPLASGRSLKLHVSKEADRTFASSLVSLLNSVKMAMEMQEDFEAINKRPVDLLTGCFTGIKALIESGSDETAQQGLELFHMALARLFGSLQKTYQGEVVGVILLSEQTSAMIMEPMLHVKLSPRASRWLNELPSANTTYAEVVLVRRTLAWITGIILLLSALIGVYYLLYMPFNRDTLLYSNVKWSSALDSRGDSFGPPEPFENAESEARKPGLLPPRSFCSALSLSLSLLSLSTVCISLLVRLGWDERRCRLPRRSRGREKEIPPVRSKQKSHPPAFPVPLSSPPFLRCPPASNPLSPPAASSPPPPLLPFSAAPGVAPRPSAFPPSPSLRLAPVSSAGVPDLALRRRSVGSVPGRPLTGNLSALHLCGAPMRASAGGRSHRIPAAQL